MPNICNNYITIKFASENELQDFVNARIDSHHGWDKKIISKGTRGIILTNKTCWQPDFNWLKNTLEHYGDCWIKNDWTEEGGLAGVWIGQYCNGELVVNEMKWLDLGVEDRAFLFGWDGGRD
jgi:hypothetical protein